MVNKPLDQRKFTRLFASSSIKLFEANGKLICKASVADLSQEGLLVAFFDEIIDKSLNEQKEIKFEFIIPTGPVEGAAKIMWLNSKESKFGLKFLKIENDDGASNLLSFIANDFL